MPASPPDDRQPTVSASRTTVREAVRAQAATWYRTLPGLVACGTGTMVALSLLVMAARPVLVANAPQAGVDPSRSLATMAAFGLASTALLLGLALASSGVTAIVVDRHRAELATSSTAAAATAVRRLPAAGAVIVATAVVVGTLVLLAPLVSAAALLGLLLAPLLGSRDRYPGTRRLVADAVPLAAAVRALGARSLALPAVWLDGLGPVEALARSRERTRGRELRLAGLLVVLSLLVAAGTLAVAVGGRFLATPTTGALANAAATVLLGGLPIVAMTLAYRHGHPGPTGPPAPLPPSGRGTAVTAAFALVATLLPSMAATAPAMAVVGLTASSVSVWTTPAAPLPGVPFTVQVSTADASGAPTEDVPVGDVLVTTTGADGTVQEQRTLTVTGPGSQPSYSTQLAAGTFTLTATYPGNGTYAPATDVATLTLVAPKATTTTTLVVDDPTPTFGDAVTLTATVTPAPAAGTVTFQPAGGTPVPGVPLVGGVATLSLPALTAGLHEYTAFYPGDLGHEPSLTATATAVQVAPVATTTSLAITPPSPTAAGQQLVATVSVAAADPTLAPNGTVNVLSPSGGVLASAPYLGAAVAIPFTPPAGNDQAFTATFVPGANFAASQAQAVHTVDLAAASLVVRSTGAAVGDPLVLTATVTGGSVPTGTVTFRSGPTAAGPDLTGTSWTKAVVAGVATAQVGTVSGVETHWFARYDGDAALAATDWVVVAHTAQRAASKLAAVVVAPVGAVHLGDDVTLAVTVTGDPPTTTVPTGTVTAGTGATAASATLAAGSTTVVVPAPADGRITLRYGGSTAFEGADATLELTLQRRATVVLANDPAQIAIVHGDTLTVTGAVTTVGTTAKPSGRVRLVTNVGTAATATLTAAGHFSLSTAELPTTATLVSVEYEGDEHFRGSHSAPVAITVRAVETAVTLAATPAQPALGQVVTLTATMPDLGVGPVGDVELLDLEGTLARATPVDGVATFEVAITALRTNLYVRFVGDANFDAADSPVLTIAVLPAVPTVALTGDGSYAWGQTGTVTATVVGPPAIPVVGTVDLLDGTTGDVLLAAVPLDQLGRATATVCRGACAPGQLALPARTTSLRASYRGSELLAAASSPLLGVTSTAASTSLTMTASARSVRVGDGVQLVARVGNLDSGAVPVGDATFLARDDATGASRLLGRQALLSDGSASLVVVAGRDLPWASTTVVAEFHPADAAAFGPSHAQVTIAVGRIGTTTEVVGPSTVAAGEPATFAVRVRPVGQGFLERPTGSAVVTAAGRSCTASVAAGSGSCTITFTSPTDAGDGHVALVDYAGDPSFEPSRGTAPQPTEVTRQLAHLSARGPADARVGVPTRVTWSLATAALGGPAPTGDVVVTSTGGRLVCREALDAGGCEATFARGDEGPWDLVVAYLGDRQHLGGEARLHVTVVGCHDLLLQDFTGGGELRAVTPHDCDGGWLAGTQVEVLAIPHEGHRFTGWERPDPDDPNGWLAAGTTEALVVRVTDHPATHRLRGGFERRCHAVAFTTSGSGTLHQVPSHDHRAVACTTDTGGAGWLHGSPIVATAVPLHNPRFGEHDEFHGHGALPVGATVDRLGYVRWTVTGPATLHADFGPVCHQLTLPRGIRSETAHNCTSPTGTGHLRWTDVTVASTLPANGRVLEGWLANGTLVAAAGRGTTTTWRLDADTSLDTRWVTCHAFEVRLDGAPRRDDPTLPVGTVDAAPAPNCPDGTPRYVDGTTVALTPQVHEPQARFQYWVDGPVPAFHALGEADVLRPSRPARPGGRALRTEVAPDGSRSVTVDRPFETRAAFWSRKCSPLDFRSPAGLAHLRSPDRFAGVHAGLTGCGPFGYHDRYADMAYADLRDLERRRGKVGMRLEVVTDPSAALGMPIVASTNAAVPTCVVTSCNGPVTGYARIDVLVCPTVDLGVQFVRSDDEASPASRTRYTLHDLVGPEPDHDWVEAEQWSEPWGECAGANSPNVRDGAMEFGSRLRLRTVPPDHGAFTFNGWASPHVGVTTSMVPATHDNGLGPGGWLPLEGHTSPIPWVDRVEVDAVYTLNCRDVVTGQGISLQPAPNCPGNRPGERAYLRGTILRATAAPRIAPDRPFKGFSHGVVAGSEWRVDETSGRVAGIAIVGDETLEVHGAYPTPPTFTQQFVSGLAIAGKAMVGVAAVLTVVAVSALCAPCGVALAVVAATALLVDLIPGTHGVAGAAFDLVNPLSAVECAARWGFAPGSAGPYAPPASSPPSGLTREDQADLARGSGLVGKVGSVSFGASKAAVLAKSGQKALAAKEAAAGSLSNMGVKATTGGRLMQGGGAVISAGAGLYAAGAHEMTLDYQTNEDLRATGAMTSCLEEKYRGVWNAKAP